jgi:hypothetical protein
MYSVSKVEITDARIDDNVVEHKNKKQIRRKAAFNRWRLFTCPGSGSALPIMIRIQEHGK